MRIKLGRAKTDPEKLVTPGILFVSKKSGGVSGYGLALGWWDFHVTILWTSRP